WKYDVVIWLFWMARLKVNFSWVSGATFDAPSAGKIPRSRGGGEAGGRAGGGNGPRRVSRDALWLPADGGASGAGTIRWGGSEPGGGGGGGRGGGMRWEV